MIPTSGGTPRKLPGRPVPAGSVHSGLGDTPSRQGSASDTSAASGSAGLDGSGGFVLGSDSMSGTGYAGSPWRESPRRPRFDSLRHHCLVV